MTLVAPVPYAQISRDVYGYGNVPTQTTNAQSFVPPPQPPQPPPHYPPALQVNPSHTQQSYASSSVSPYPQPYAHHAAPDRYGPAPTQPLPPGWPAPEHYVFPYGYPPYGQAHPIMMIVIHQRKKSLSSILLSPTNADRRPPPPQESDAVAGYRAVGPVTEPGTQWEETYWSTGENKSPSPPPPPPPSGLPPPAVEDQPEKPERVVTTFSIGVTPGDAPPSHARSRTRSQLRLSHTENPLDGKDLEAHTAAEVDTNPEIKWEFGTANRPQDEPTQGDDDRPEPLERQSRPLAPAAPPKPTLDVSLLFSGPLQSSSLPAPSTEPPLAEVQHPYPHAHHSIPYGLPQHQMHVPPIPPVQEELQVQTGPGAFHQPPMQSLSSSSVDGFEVKNFGYGFGRPNEPGHGVTSPRDERLPREREWERSREVEREPYAWRPRRGSYNGHNERGGFAGRRGRGTNGFGRAVSGRGFGRGGPTISTLAAIHTTTAGPVDMGQYLGTTIQQPTPIAETVVQSDVPLDPTRFYLLGQLEYYLSAQNLVSDIFLRKRGPSADVDSQLVREVLALSQVVEMRDDCVRMGGGEWAQFVLPDAPVSAVEAGSVGMGHGEDGVGDQDRDPAEEDADVEEEEEEEEIEIVMDRVIGQPWTAPP
ncbi:hypothetical protein BC826DRAFT_969387 [Russula brevipes]|nr:hypothetical protein BC826DRAFT_969387 [Russula brevipes]